MKPMIKTGFIGRADRRKYFTEIRILFQFLPTTNYRETAPRNSAGSFAATCPWASRSRQTASRSRFVARDSLAQRTTLTPRMTGSERNHLLNAKVFFKFSSAVQSSARSRSTKWILLLARSGSGYRIHLPMSLYNQCALYICMSVSSCHMKTNKLLDTVLCFPFSTLPAAVILIFK